MNALIAMLVAAVPQAVMYLAGKVFAQELVNKILARVVVAGLEHASRLTVNTVDDEIVADIKQRLQE